MTSTTPSPISDQAAGFDMLVHLARQRAWSELTFGTGARTKGVVDHIRKELTEIEADPTDLTEWIDVVILALDGAWRAGGSPEQIIATMVAKQTKNEGRTWPDWRTADPDKAIKHDRAKDAAPTTGSAPVAVRVCPVSDIECSSAHECESTARKCRKIAAPASPAASVLTDDGLASEEHADALTGNAQAASVPFLCESDMSALMTFHSQMEDHEADGYTVHKETMKRLAELGVVNSLGFGRYETTAFGAWLVEKAFEQDPTLPLRTVAEHNERSAILAASMGGDKS